MKMLTIYYIRYSQSASVTGKTALYPVVDCYFAMSEPIEVLLWMIRLVLGIASILLFAVNRTDDAILVAIFMLLANQDLILFAINGSKNEK